MRLFPLLTGALLVPIIASAQTTIRANTPLHATPDGVLLATVRGGATVDRGPAKGGWTRVTLEGYVYKTGIGGKRDTFDISAASDGILLRASASTKGTRLASLKEGMGLVQVGRRGEWLKVRRTAWVKSASLSGKSAPTVATSPSRAPDSPDSAQPASGTGAPGDDSTSAAHGDVAGSADSTARGGGDAPAMAAGRRTELRRAPGGGVVAALDSNANVSVLARERGWTLVRLEGWVPDSSLVPVDGTMLTAISAAGLRAEPDRYRGQTVRWEVQKIALQTADPLRRDLAPDEPYILARGPGEERSLLYLALPRALVDQARRIEPLTRITVTARVRTGRSEPSGVPLLEVISISER